MIRVLFTNKMYIIHFFYILFGIQFKNVKKINYTIIRKLFANYVTMINRNNYGRQ